MIQKLNKLKNEFLDSLTTIESNESLENLEKDYI
jgi:hypothetical protein